LTKEERRTLYCELGRLFDADAIEKLLKAEEPEHVRTILEAEDVIIKFLRLDLIN
jgi:HEAT repeat protein